MTLWAINRAAHGRRENYVIKIIQIKEGFCVCESGFTMYEFFKIDDRVLKAAEEAEQKAAPYLAKISETQRYNQEKMQAAFMQAGVSESHFVATTGYGYGDRGRDVLDEVYARALGAEDALCRYNFVSGTHTLTVALFGVLRPGDTMLSVTGMPYDTLRGVIGITGDGNGSLKEFGINYEQLDLLPDGTPDYDGMETAITPKHRMVYIQRSRGYSLRPSLTVEEIERIVKIAKRRAPDCIVMVDNCYGEYVQKMEPTAVGADLMAGSLIKNPGGGIAPTGGYIAGRADLVELCAHRLSAPGVGREVGCTLGELRPMYQGLFFSPVVTASAVRTAVFASRFFELCGFKADPSFDEPRTDIIETIALGSPKALCAFCRGIQSGSPIDSYVTPEPWDMPGYDSQVIMAAGAFVQGASIELSADGPMRDPYMAYLQGGITYESGKLGILLALEQLGKIEEKA